MKEIILNVEGMHCEGCENRVKSAVKSIEGVEKVEANHLTGIVEIEQVHLKHFYDSLTIAKIIDLKEQETLQY